MKAVITLRSLSLLLSLFLYSLYSFAQTPDLGTASSFAVFTAAGAFDNQGTSVITGDIGTNVGAFNGFPPGIVIGSIHVADPVTVQAATDVMDAYGYLSSLTCGQVLTSPLGNGQILAPNIYCMGAASTLNGTLVLDGGGDPNAIFIFQIDGAFSTSTNAHVVLTGLASLCNVYWQINGAFTLGDSSSFVGTIVANGAIHLLQGSSLEGRALTQAGAIDLHTNIVTVSEAPTAAVITANGSLALCAGESVTLSGNIDGIWNTGASTASITVSSAGDYYVVNTTACGSDTSNHLIVTVNALPDCTITGDNSFCTGQSATICAVAGAISYQWSTGEITSCIDVSTAGTFFVTVTDANGCSNTCSFDVAESTGLNCTITGDLSICQGQSTNLCTPIGAASYAWSNGDVTNCTLVSTAGTYGVTITESNGCTSTCSVVVTLTTPAPCTITGAASFCAGQTSTICTAAGAAAYAWSNGAITNCTTISSAGTYTVTVTDANGCTSSCDFTATVNPTPNCTITGSQTICQGQSTVLCTAAGFANYMWSNGGITNCITVNAAGTYVVTVTDGNGCTSSCNITVTITTGALPVITCPANVTIQCNAVTLPSNTGTATATGGCNSTPTITYTNAVVQGNCPQASVITRTWTATDAAGNTATCNQIISVVDNTAPSITCPVSITVQCAGLIPAANPSGVVASDNCGGVTTVTFLGDVITNQTCANRYTVTRRYQAVDACGNSTSCAQTITVFDNSAPSITCPASITVQCAALIPAANPASVVASDNCGGATTVTLLGEVTTNQTCANRFTVTRTYQAVDACGNSATCAQTITVFDNSAPSITCPASITVQCAALIPTANTTGIVTSDNCGGAATVTFLGDVNTNVTCANRLTVNRTYQAVDACGNSTTCVQTITVFDNTAPFITCPASITVQCASLIPAANTASVVTSDNCGGATTVTLLGEVTTNQTCANRFTITRTYQAVDACGNSTTCAQTITVFDNSAPSITCPASITVQCASLIPAANTASVVTSDNCGGATTVTLLGEVTTNQTCANRFTVTRTYQAVDACGNTSTCAQTITVFDNTAPSITCPVSITVQCAALIPAANPAAVVTSDNCGGAATVTFIGDVNTNQTCANRFTVNRTYQAVDACGNSTTCVQTITVFDNIGPSITCPANVTLQCAGTIPVANPASIVAVDNCGGSTVVVLVGDVITNQLCANNFTMSRTYSATDACGNVAQCTQVFTVLDNIPPVITCPAPVTVQCASLVPAPNVSTVVSNDNCGTSTVTFLNDVISNQVCANNYILTRTYRSTDLCGNSSTCTQIIRVLDVTAPVINFDNLPFVNGETFEIQCYGQDPTWDLPVYDASSINATDNCNGPVTVTFQQTIEDEGNCQTDGYINLYRLSWTATDQCGNTASAFAFIALVDTIVPVLNGIPDDITVNCNQIPAVPATIYATDECLCACVITFEESVPLPGCQNNQVITRTWAARDRCGNVRVEQQRITLISTAGPILDLLPQQLVNVANGSVLDYTCNEGGIPAFFDAMSAASVTGTSVCGADVDVNFHADNTSTTNCDFFGYIEQRIYQWIGTDECGNSTTMKITVHLIDDEAPVFVNLPTIACISDPALAAIEAVDNCGNVGVSFWDVQVPNPCGDGFAFRRTYEASDDCGNMATDTVMLIPNDMTHPVMEIVKPGFSGFPLDGTLELNCASNGSQYTNFNAGDVLFTDACMQGVNISFQENIISIGDCEENGNVAQLELLWTATDVCGNLSELSQLVNIVDHTGPVFNNFLPSMTIGCQDTIPAVFATDNCDVVSISTVDKIIQGDCASEYTIERTIMASDPCGNTTIQLQTVHVGDGSGPVIEGVESQICVDQPLPIVTAFDNCGGTFVDVVMTEDTVTVCEEEVLRRTWRAIDACGNTSEQIQLVIPNDHEPPVILVPSYSIIWEWMDSEINQISLSAKKRMNELNELNVNSISVQDGCDQDFISVFTIEVTPLNCAATGFMEHRTYRWIATDACGNADTLTFGVNIIDDIPPAFLVTPGDITITCEPLPTASIVQMFDLSLPINVTYAETMIEIAPGVFIVTRTWKAVDQCGNQSIYQQHIRWTPNTLLDCEILIPNVVECNTHGVAIEAACTDTDAVLTYHWEIVGEKCFIQSGQGTPGILIYVGFSGLNISLTVTDAFGCSSISNVDLDCVEPFDNTFAGTASNDNPASVNGQQATSGSTLEDEHSSRLKNLNLWPNPAVEGVNLSFEAERTQPVELIVYNYLGQPVYANQFITEIGTNSRLINVSQMPAGSYMVKVKTDQALQTKIFMVLQNGGK